MDEEGRLSSDSKSLGVFISAFSATNTVKNKLPFFVNHQSMEFCYGSLMSKCKHCMGKTETTFSSFPHQEVESFSMKESGQESCSESYSTAVVGLSEFSSLCHVRSLFLFSCSSFHLQKLEVISKS